MNGLMNLFFLLLTSKSTWAIFYCLKTWYFITLWVSKCHLITGIFILLNAYYCNLHPYLGNWRPSRIYILIYLTFCVVCRRLDWLTVYEFWALVYLAYVDGNIVLNCQKNSSESTGKGQADCTWSLWNLCWGEWISTFGKITSRRSRLSWQSLSLIFLFIWER